ncbi:MAG: glucose-1-phosphate thymidylyltransferase, partial [Pararhodobacter sp.]
LQSRQGLQVGCPEEIAFQQGWIDRDALAARAAFYGKTDYGRYLARLMD